MSIISERITEKNVKMFTDNRKALCKHRNYCKYLVYVLPYHVSLVSCIDSDLKENW